MNLKKSRQSAEVQQCRILPHGVLVGFWQFRVGDGCTVVRSHDALSKDEVTKQTCEKQILPKQLLKEFCNETKLLSNFSNNYFFTHQQKQKTHCKVKHYYYRIFQAQIASRII